MDSNILYEYTEPISDARRIRHLPLQYRYRYGHLNRNGNPLI